MNDFKRPISVEALTVAERILLVEEIWDSIAAQEEAVEITREQQDELDRRLAR